MPTIPANRLKYTLTSASAGTRIVTPLGEGKLKLEIDLHDDPTDPLYDYIYKLNGRLVLAGDDYTWIMALEEDISVRGDDILIEVKDLRTDTVLVAGTKFILNEAFFDLDRCQVEIPISTPDVYATFNAKKNDQINFFDLLISGTFYDIKVLDYVPKFEINYSPITYTVGSGSFDFGDQHFKYYPNKRAQYPGFSVEDEQEEDGYPNAAETLFDTRDLIELTNNADGVPEIGIGTYPVFKSAPTTLEDPVAMKAEGWRLYAFRYDIFRNEPAGIMWYFGHFCWTREIIDVAIGTPMDPEWFFVGVVGGMDRYARPPLLVPRTNINRTSFTMDGFPNEYHHRLMQTTYVVGLDYTNVVLYSGAGAAYPHGTAVDPTAAIMSLNQDEEYQNYYSFDSLVNGKSLNDVIEWAVDYCDPSLTVKSDFFQINPFTVSTDNPVTGLPSFTNDIMMYQKSDVKRPFATNHATRGMLTADKLLIWLMEMFNVKYRIEGTDFVIEHITSPFFVRPATIDLTVAPYNEFLNGLRRYNYDAKMRLPAKETFKFMEARPQGDTEPLNDFNGLPITYNGSNVDRTKEGGLMEHLVDGITTDVHYILIHSGGIGYIIDANTKNPYPVQNAATDDAIAEDGFVLVASNLVVTGPTSERYMIIADPIVDTDRRMNNVLGWAHLHAAFFMSNRNTKYGEMNGAATTFDSTKYIKQSVVLPVTICDISEFDPFELIDSALGEGIVKHCEYTFIDSTLRLTLGYPE